MPGASSTSADPAGFRLERRLGDHTWEATQVELGRRVVLTRLDPGVAFDVTAWPRRPGVVPLYAVIEWNGDRYVATRLIEGARTLAEVRRIRRRWLDGAAAILADHPHGDLTAGDLLVDPDGALWVTGFGRDAGRDDRAALAAMRPPERSRRAALPAAAGVMAVAVAVALLARGDGEPAMPAPPVTRGATAFGSALTPGGVRTVDCEGRVPSGSSSYCTIMQTDLGGRPLVVPYRGLVRAWAVRGARGRVSLQILRPTPQGYLLYNNTRSVALDGTPRRIAADRSVPKGSRFALLVEPGGGIGVRGGVAGAADTRFIGPVTSREARRPGSTKRGEELLLRVDVVRRPR